MGNCFKFWKGSFELAHLLEVMTILEMPVMIKADDTPTYVSNKMKQFFAYYNIKHATGISHNPTGQAVIERVNCTLKEMLIKQKVRVKSSGTD